MPTTSELWLRDAPTPRQRRNDAILGLVLAASGVLGVELMRSSQPGLDLGWHDVEAYALAGAQGLVLCVRRTFPLSMMIASAVVFFLIGHRMPLIGTSFSVQIAMFMSIYTAWAWSRHRRPLRWTSVVVVIVMFAWVGWQIYDRDMAAGVPKLGLLDPAVALIVYVLVVNAVYFFGAIGWGTVSWRGARQRAELRRQADELAREQEVNAQRAVAEERVRIARELHDVVAHHVSSIGVQAAGARRLLDRAPETATEALRTIEGSSRSAVSEMHRLVGLLRAYENDDSVGDRSPQPGLDDLDRLVADANGARTEVALNVVGEPYAVSGTIGLSIYRTVQEALSNVREHSTAGGVKVVLRYLDVDGHRNVEAEVTDDGSPRKPSGRGDGGGWGLQGIRERVSLHRGESEIGPRPSGGFRVRVRLPMEDE